MASNGEQQPMTLEDAATLLRRFQLNEWALDRRVTKKAQREQSAIVCELLERMCRREITKDELAHALDSMN